MQGRWGFAFFFFQAEDGIRDADMTGVQTCALPIYLLLVPLHDFGRSHGEVPAASETERAVVPAAVLCDLCATDLQKHRRREGHRVRSEPHWFARSEERRVGKECRCREWMEK